MPENNPFSSLADEKPANPLTAREKLFADMGLSPDGKPELADVFAGSDDAFLDADFDLEPAVGVQAKPDHFISLGKVEPKLAAEEDLVVDAIFSSTETEKIEAPAVQVEAFTLHFAEPAVESIEEEQVPGFAEAAVNQPSATTAALLKSLDHAGLDTVVAAYTDLQKRLAANQTVISAEREAIAELRNHMRQLNALDHHDLTENSAGLEQSRKLIQADSCQNLLRSINQVNEMIQRDGQGVAQLLTPIKAGVEVLELRVKHVNAIESLLKHIQEGLALQKQLNGADSLLRDLAKHLGLTLA
ncbi:MAG: hypothetical protein WBP46_02190 [Thiolinea sp.]